MKKIKEAGFTFIEVLIVVIIISIMSVLSVPRFKKTYNTFQFNTFSSQLQDFINYLKDRSVVEGKIICLNIDNGKKEYWAQIKDSENILKTYRIPVDLQVELDVEGQGNENKFYFYPDGYIDKVTITVSMVNSDSGIITLTTKGVFSGVKAY